MSDNLGLAQLSDHLLIVAVVIYSLAMLAYAGDFAYGRRVKAASAAGKAARPVPELAGVRAGSGAGTPETPATLRRGDAGHDRGRRRRRRRWCSRRPRIRARTAGSGWDR